MRIKHLRHITEDMKISILPTVPIVLMQKSPATSTKAVEHNKFVDYILQNKTKKTSNLAF